MRALVFIAFFYMAVNMGNTAQIVKSRYDFDTTINNVYTFLTQRNIPIFTEFNHSKNAQEAELQLYPTKVIVFGNPKVGTLLMQENQQIGIELPLKIIVWEDSKRNVFVTSTDIKNLARQYRLTNNNVVENIAQLLTEILNHSAK
ncbi:DUF302 domain-containing protein [Helicobacter aurati]|uniref:DUF302 domain-containing protein n=1 Tax=Helicobacter aurati TaxID=137778 RepID=A0A3D8J4C0_9HELI|nr:DUF302 domain-containing protein [Helicobacter aurati]RDU72308.1 DUF302 domain-containing protein [Helicobacter aurati]